MQPTTSYRNPYVVADAAADERAAFIRRTYGHLAMAIVGFLALETALVQWSGAEALVGRMIGGRFSWLIVLGAFMGVSWMADRWARSDTSPAMQYLGLGLFVVAEAIIFLPLLYIAVNFSSPDVLPTAGILTGVMFGGLTATVLITRHDFSFLRTALTIGSFVALGLIACSIMFGFSLGLVFSVAMIVLASGAILYTTSNLIHEYRTDQHVSAALALFSSVALLFWYLLQLVMSLGGDD